jgi:hypothetical protein
MALHSHPAAHACQSLLSEFHFDSTTSKLNDEEINSRGFTFVFASDVLRAPNVLFW